MTHSRFFISRLHQHLRADALAYACNALAVGRTLLAPGYVDDHGEVKYRKFWQLMMAAPRAHTARDSAARFVQIAHAATGADYRGLLKDSSLPLEIDPATVSRTTSFAADLHADSLALVEVVEIVEGALRARVHGNFEIDDDDIEDLETVGAAADYAVARL